MSLRWSGSGDTSIPWRRLCEREIVAQLLHQPVHLAHVGGLVADRAHEEAPVARL